jgi:hypothetical protein
MRSWIRKLLPPRVIDGQVVPPDARVDPAAFPDDQFPVYCPQCRYLLRGLTSDRCPECGTPFDRGRLLVGQYIFSPERWQCARSWKWAIWAMVIGFLPTAASALFAFGTQLLADPATQPRISIDTMLEIGHWLTVARVAGMVLWAVAAALFLRLAIVTKKKRMRVFRAIDRSTPAYQRAQKRRWPFVVISLAIVAALVCWNLREERGWLGYYSSSPPRVLIPIAAAIVIGVLIFLAARLWKRWENRHSDPDA